LNNRSTLFAKMREGAMIITPNNRLSNQLLRDFMRATPSTKCIEKPHCLPYTQFLRTSYQRLLQQTIDDSNPLLLTPAQETLLWKGIIGPQCSPHLLQQVQEAWNRCQLWQIAMPFAENSQTPQIEQFLNWHQAFVAQLTQHHWLAEAQLGPQLIQRPFKPDFPEMIWVSFDDYTPQQTALQLQFESMGCPQYHNDLKPTECAAEQYQANDQQDELTQLIHWLHHQLSQNVQRIAVIVPELSQQSSRLERRFRRSFRPEQFDISLGKPLSQFPLVAHALQWLSLERTPLTNHVGRLLLSSPYLDGSQSESIARAEVLESNPLLQEAHIPFEAFVNSIQSITPQLAKILGDLSPYPQNASPLEWVQQFKSRLTLLGFPGEYGLQSAAYQYFQRLQTLFDEFLQLALIQAEMTLSEALQALRDLANTSIFQIKKDPAPIQVSGLLEASGCEFDCIWVMGLTDQCLPQRVNLSPFIPFAIQRQLQMPHALPHRELKLAQQLLNRLKYGAQQAVFSYPKLLGDAPQLPSPLIDSLPAYKPTILPALTAHTSLEPYSDSYHYPMTDDDIPSGGASLLANQAQCPFRAFAAHRLHAKRGLSQSTGLNDAERGQVIHRILENLWRQWQNQAALLNLSVAQREEAIDQAISTVLTKAIQHRNLSCPTLIQDLERHRLKQLVLAALDWEVQRPPFVVEAIESTYTLTLAGLDLKLRIDRLDRVASDETWVIDYKSRFPTHKPWQAERPEAPQLLLYALLDPSIQALLFLQLKTGQVLCNGISQDDHEVPGLAALKPDQSWTDYQNQWHQRLTQLATEFKTGHCHPTPQHQTTCQRCEFRQLCRT